MHDFFFSVIYSNYKIIFRTSLNFLFLLNIKINCDRTNISQLFWHWCKLVGQPLHGTYKIIKVEENKQASIGGLGHRESSQY